MPDGYLLTPGDHAALRKLLDDYRGEYVRPRGVRPPVEGGETPELYVAQAPAGGIPAISGTTPGSATCDIYKVSWSGGTPTLSVLSGFTKKVLNLSSSAVTGSSWLVAQRDKFGDWWADPAAAAASVSLSYGQAVTGGGNVGILSTYSGINSIILPSAGTYELGYDMTAVGEVTAASVAGGTWDVKAKLYNSTAATDITTDTVILATDRVGAAGDNKTSGRGSDTQFYVASASITVSMQAIHSGVGTGTVYVPPYSGRIRYLKIS